MGGANESRGRGWKPSQERQPRPLRGEQAPAVSRRQHPLGPRAQAAESQWVVMTTGTCLMQPGNSGRGSENWLARPPEHSCDSKIILLSITVTILQNSLGIGCLAIEGRAQY